MASTPLPANPQPSGTSLGRWLSHRDRGWYILGYVLLVIIGLWTIFPFYWQLATSVQVGAMP